jgi:hypothetical protein
VKSLAEQRNSRNQLTHFLMGGVCVAALLLAPENLRAERAPLTPEKLGNEASHVVTGRVSAIEIRSESSEMEGFGCFDFAIYCTIAVHRVEKGEGVQSGEELVARCFRAKTRLALGQSAGFGGHKPIPKPGQAVRAYLRRQGSMYHAVYPNGFTPMGEGQLVEPDEVRQLGRWSPLGTFLLPLEFWVLLVILVLLLVAVLAVVVPRTSRRKVVQLVLGVSATLATVGLGVGFAQFLAAMHDWTAGIAIVVAGVCGVAAFAALTAWLFRSALRKPTAHAKAEEALSGPSA